MKKKGPHRSQSLKAFPGSSLNGLGKTTSFKLLTILDRSLFTVSQTGSVNVLGAGPNPDEAIGGTPPVVGRAPVEGGNGGSEETGGTTGGTGLGFGCVETGGTGAGRGEEETGIEARGGEGGRAGSTVEGYGCEFMRFSISSMSDWELECKGMVSL